MSDRIVTVAKCPDGEFRAIVLKADGTWFWLGAARSQDVMGRLLAGCAAGGMRVIHQEEADVLAWP